MQARRAYWLAGLGFALCALGIPAVLYVLEILRTGLGSYSLDVRDPDSWLRLHEVRHWLMGGVDFYDKVIVRANAPFGGVITPWTRPVDFLLTGLIGMFSLTGTTSSLLLASAVYGPLLGVAAAVAALKILQLLVPNAGALEAVLAILLACILKPAIFNFVPGNVDHHGLQLVAFLWLMVALLRNDRATAPLTGLWLALLCWISPEGLIWVLFAFAWFAVRSLWIGAEAARLRIASVTLAGLLVAVYGLEQPWSAWAQHHELDTLSSLYLVVYLLIAACALLWDGLRPWWDVRGIAQRLACGLLLAGACAISIWLLAPRFFLGPMADAPASAITYFLPSIYEAQPFYRLPWQTILSGFALDWAVVALMVLMPLAGMPKERRGLIIAALLWSIALSGVQLRFGQYSLAPLLLAVWMPAIASRIAARPWMDSFTAGLRVPMILLGFVAVLLGWQHWLQEQVPAGAWHLPCERSIYDAARSGALQQMIPERDAVVLTPKNIEPPLLFFTQYHLVAGTYHREADAILWLDTAYRMAQERQLRQMLRERKIEYALVCPSELPENSVLARVAAGKMHVTWLEKMEPQQNHGAFALYRLLP